MLDELDVFLGEAAAHSAQLYARLPRPVDAEAWRIEGQVRGPFLPQGRTLPAVIPLVDAGPGPTLLAKAVIPDPCFWSPDSPVLYEVSLRVLHEGREVAADVRRLGIRRLGSAHRSFRFESQRWVLRGIDRSQVRNEPQDVVGDRQLHAWHELSAAVVELDPDDALCAAAAREGVVVVGRLNTAGETWRDDLRRLAHWASVGLVVLEGPGVEPDVRVRTLAPNLCLVQPFRVFQTIAAAPWAHAVQVDVGDSAADFAQRVADCSLPIIARRPLSTPCELPEARAAVDALQRELATVGDYAGYLV
ncbi:MAG: hypothetical protein U0939_07335 [Pirellulales bacterium]